MVPWPAMTPGSSYGWMKVRPSRSASSCAWAADSARVSPCSTTRAPQPSVRTTLVTGVNFGMTIVAAMPASEACRATAWAWLPADMATTPAARSRAVSRAMRLAAPPISPIHPAGEVPCRATQGWPTRGWRFTSTGTAAGSAVGNRRDLIGAGASGGRDLDAVADLLADQCLGQRGGDRDRIDLH